MSNFLRKDLILNKKWGHRLLVVVFFWLFIYCLFSLSKSFIFEWMIGPIYQIESSLEDRITSEVKSAKELSNYWEILDWWSDWIMFIFWWIWDNKYKKIDSYTTNLNLEEFFCSNQLYNQLNNVIKRSWISTFYIKEINNYLEPISMKTTIEYIKNNNVKCILIDGFWGENKFLNPWWAAQEYQKHYFYKKSNISFFLNTLNILSWIIIITIGLAIPFSLLMFIYYKVILYVIYGSSKNDKKK